MKYSNEWIAYVHRQARWVDFEHGYKTMDLTYMESVLWAFKQLWEKGLAYQGYRVLPYCPKDETPLSNHELRMDADVYQDKQDQTVSVAVKLREEADAYLVFWTTTPWTVPTNFAVVVGADIDYVEVLVHSSSNPAAVGKKFYFAKALLDSYTKELGDDYEVVRELKGTDMQGWKYWPVFPYFNDTDPKDSTHPGHNAFQVFTADYVDTNEGSGLVHQAPYGEDDMATLDAHDITSVDVIDAACHFTSLVPDYEGMMVFDANMPIIRNLRAGDGPLAGIDADKRALLFQEKSYVHSYPHCWRCGTPLVYKPVSSWFIKVADSRDRMLELNEQINWVPQNVKDGQFGKWLAGARDWSISRNRYWGSPIPVWVSDNPQYPRIDVYGSLDEFKADFGCYPTDAEGNVNLHRPWIDELSRPNPDDPSGKSSMHRISDIFDVWFDSASMPFAQAHYPFENKEWFETHFPPDFVVEYIGQTRGWFYVQNVLSTLLFDKPAFKNVVCHGIVLGDDGQKMSKHLHNYPDVAEVFNDYGSDAMRWFLMSSPVLRGGNLVVTQGAIRDAVRQVLLPLWSSYYFFTLYANAANQGDGYSARSLRADEVAGLPRMDRYLLAQMRTTICDVQKALDEFAIANACEVVEDFIDVLTNWYIRNTRDRFWHEDENAFNTLYTVLEALCRVIAPLLPMESETMWRGLTGGESVHLADWPFVVSPADGTATSGTATPGASTPLGEVFVEDETLSESMDKVRAVVSAVLSLRKDQQIRVRQPLSVLTVVVDNPREVLAYEDLLKSELNIKKIDVLTLAAAQEQGLRLIRDLRVNARAAGPRIGKQVQLAIKASKSGDWYRDDAGVIVVRTPEGEIPLEPAEYELSERIEANGSGSSSDDSSVSAELASGGFVILDITLTPELKAEGWARDAIRVVQDARKDAGFEISDRIRLVMHVPSASVSDGGIAAAEAFRDLIASETLAAEFEILPGDSGEFNDSDELSVEVSRI